MLTGKACPGNSLYLKPRPYKTWADCLSKTCSKLYNCAGADFVNGKCEMKEGTMCDDDELVDAPGNVNIMRLCKFGSGWPRSYTVVCKLIATNVLFNRKWVNSYPRMCQQNLLGCNTYLFSNDMTWMFYTDLETRLTCDAYKSVGYSEDSTSKDRRFLTGIDG